MKRLLIIFLFAFSIGGEAKVNIVATTTNLASIAGEIGGDKVKVFSLTKGIQDAHYIAPKPSMILQVNKADLLIYVGASLEVAWLPTLIKNSRNRKILAGSDGQIDFSEEISLLEVPTKRVDRSMGDVHPEGNPHYMLDPRNGLIVAGQIFERLSKLDRKNHEVYRKNFEQFDRQLREKIAEWENRLKRYEDRQIVTYHKQWEYLVSWLQLSIVNYVEPKPGIPPSPRHVRSLREQMSSAQIEVLLCSNNVNTKLSRQVASKSGVKLLILPVAVSGEKELETYIDLFDRVISELELAFENRDSH